jgi:hypothetical protein
MRVTWPSSGPKRGAPSPSMHHAPLTPSHTHPSSQRPSAAVHARGLAAVSPDCLNSLLEPSPRAPSSSTRTTLPLNLLPSTHYIVKPPARRSHCSSGWRSAPPPNPTADHSSNLSNLQNGTLSKQGPLPALSRPSPAFSSPESDHLHHWPRLDLIVI